MKLAHVILVEGPQLVVPLKKNIILGNGFDRSIVQKCDPQRAEKLNFPVLCESELNYLLKISEISTWFPVARFPLVEFGV